MAKPIFVVKIKGSPSPEDSKAIIALLIKEVGEDYHVLTIFDDCLEGKYFFECFNDCKGLKDIDIEKLINEYHETKST